MYSHVHVYMYLAEVAAKFNGVCIYYWCALLSCALQMLIHVQCIDVVAIHVSACYMISRFTCQVGDRVVVAGSRTGVVRFTGAVKFAPG